VEKMATDKPRFTITLDEDTFAEVMAYKAKNKLSTQSKAVQRLVALGLESLSGEEQKEDPIIQKIKSLDARGRRVVDAVIEVESGEKVVPLPKRETKIIPLFAAAAGPGEPPSQDGFDDYEVDADSDAKFAVKISGDSMEPHLHDGDIVLCVRRRPEIGELCVIMVNGLIYVKQYITDGMNMYLRSLNRERKDCDVDVWASGNDTVTAYGTVIFKKLPLVKQ
jgi:SOS-response transcriptional repressor LexA